MTAPALPLILAAVIAFAGCSEDPATAPSAVSLSTPPTTAADLAPDTDAGTTSTSGGGLSATTSPRAAAGLGPGSGIETEASRLSPTSGLFVICQDCHAFLDPPDQPRPALNETFRHETHAARSAPCAACHESPVHTEDTVRRPTMAACYRCHGSGPDATAPGECALCHPPGFEQLPASHDDAFFEGAHAAAVAATDVEECFVCHQGGDTGFCLACHGLGIPHPPGWALDLADGPGAHVDAAHEDGTLCVRCHDNGGRAPTGCYGGECHGG